MSKDITDVTSLGYWPKLQELARRHYSTHQLRDGTNRTAHIADLADFGLLVLLSLKEDGIIMQKTKELTDRETVNETFEFIYRHGE